MSSLRSEAVLGLLLPVAPILMPLAVHFILVCFVFLYAWLPATYFFSHLVLVAVGLWACHAKTDILPAILYVGVVVVTILMDIIQLGLYFPLQQSLNGGGNTTSQRTWQFSAAMCIINLLMKPMSAGLGCVAVYIRAGGTIKGVGARNQDNYSNMDGSNEQEASE